MSNGMNVDVARRIRERLQAFAKEELLDGSALAMISMGMIEQGVVLGLMLGVGPQTIAEMFPAILDMAQKQYPPAGKAT